LLKLSEYIKISHVVSKQQAVSEAGDKYCSHRQLSERWKQFGNIRFAAAL